MFFLLSPHSASPQQPHSPNSLDRTGRQWEPIEWRVENPAWEGNPFDLVASVRFTHAETGETRTTEMFFDGDTAWRFRWHQAPEREWFPRRGPKP